MVVAQVTAVFPPYRGGIGTVAAEYAERLREHGIAVRVFSPDYHGHGSSDEVTRLRPLYAWGNAALIPSLFWKLREVDVIHLHYPFYGGDVFAWLASLVWRKPLVVTYHMKPKAQGWLGAIFRAHRRLIEPFILHRAKRIFVATQEYADENKVSNATAISILPFGIDTARFHVGRDDEFRRAHGIDPASVVMLFVGGLDDAHYFKGLSVLLRACAKLRAPNWTLMVVGSGNRRTMYEEEAQSLGIADRVKCIGSVPYQDLPRAYRAADLHILPSIDRSEAFGLVTLEAAATGIPSVVSDLPGMRSLVIPEESGLHVPPADADRLAEALDRLLQQDGYREVLGAAARARAEREYDRDTLTERLIEEYRHV